MVLILSALSMLVKDIDVVDDIDVNDVVNAVDIVDSIKTGIN
jgi:hypothetical protein